MTPLSQSLHANTNINNNNDGKLQSPTTTATSSSSSDAGYDEIFGLFNDDDKRKRRHSLKTETDASSINSFSDRNSDSSDGFYIDSDNDKDDEFSSDGDYDENDDQNESIVTFQGWTDTEIEDARRRARLTKAHI